MVKTIAKRGLPSKLDRYKGKWVAITESGRVLKVGNKLADILPFITDQDGQVKAYALFVPPKKGQIKV